LEDREDKLSPEEARLFEQAKRALPLCPEESQLRGYLYDALPPETYASTKAHVDHCDLCAARMDLIKTKDNRLTEAPPGAADAVWKNILDAARRERTASKRLADFFASLNLWRAAAAFAAVFVLVVGLLVYRQSWTPGISTPQGGAPVRGGIELSSPKETVTSFPITFEWEPVAGVSSYELTILDSSTDRPVLPPFKSQSNKLVLTRELLSALQPGKPYLWEVKGFSAAGDLTAISSRKEFTLAREIR
jgi:hypothetical protein